MKENPTYISGNVFGGLSLKDIAERGKIVLTKKRTLSLTLTLFSLIKNSLNIDIDFTWNNTENIPKRQKM